MAESFQNEVPKARINLKLDLHTGGANKKTELPLKLLVAGDFSNGKDASQISERKKVNLEKNNFDSVLSEYSPKVNLAVKNTLTGDGSEENISLTFRSMQDFSPEQIARQIPQLKAMLSMRNLLRDLKATRLHVSVWGMPYSEQFCFRPAPAPRPLIAGALTARVESDEKNAPYAHLDETGRYRVKLDFSREDAEPGYNSLWIRQAKPYAGDTYGWHTPPIDGTEVGIAFVGDFTTGKRNFKTLPE